MHAVSVYKNMYQGEQKQATAKDIPISTISQNIPQSGFVILWLLFLFSFWNIRTTFKLFWFKTYFRHGGAI